LNAEAFVGSSGKLCPAPAGGGNGGDGGNGGRLDAGPPSRLILAA